MLMQTAVCWVMVLSSIMLISFHMFVSGEYISSVAAAVSCITVHTVKLTALQEQVGLSTSLKGTMTQPEENLLLV